MSENGGINIYGFVLNDPVSLSDILGLGTYEEGSTPPRNEQPLDRSTYNTQQIGFIHFLWEYYSTTARANFTQLGGSILGFHDAQRHLKHFMDNTGSTYTIRFRGMNKESERAKQHFNSELLDAVLYTENITQGTDYIEIDIVTVDEEHSENLSGNWLYAVGEYRTWAKGTAYKCGKKYKLEWSLNFRDNYDWSMAWLLQGGLVFDREMAHLNRYGMAQEYEMVGEHSIIVEWEEGDSSSVNNAMLK